LGFGVLGLGFWAHPPNPQSPIPNPQSPFSNIYSFTNNIKIFYYNFFNIKYIILKILKMSEELKTRLDNFVSLATQNIEKKELIPDIQQEYDELIEFLDKLSILKNEEFEEIENLIKKYDIKIKKYEEQIKIYSNQKILDEEKITNLKSELDKIINLSEQYKLLDNNFNILKNNLEKEKLQNSILITKTKEKENLITELQNNMTKLNNEIFKKNEIIEELKNSQKNYEKKIIENNQQLNQANLVKNDLTKINLDLNNKIMEQEKTFTNKIKILEKQLKNLSEANINFVQENNEVQTQLKDFQIFTNMAKVNTIKLKKEDFSILEIMSNRAQNAELEVQKLLNYIENLKNLNTEITNKIKPLEDYALLQIKHDHEINMKNDSVFDIQNKIFSQEEKNEIDKLKNEPKELIQVLIKIKAENLELHKYIKDITIECNQQLREARWKNKQNI
jgi:hypothetical protein